MPLFHRRLKASWASMRLMRGGAVRQSPHREMGALVGAHVGITVWVSGADIHLIPWLAVLLIVDGGGRPQECLRVAVGTFDIDSLHGNSSSVLKSENLRTFPRGKAQMTGGSPVMSFLVFTCHLYYAPLKGKSGPKFCELSVNNKRAGPNEVQASSLQKDIRYGRIQYHDWECIGNDQ